MCVSDIYMMQAHARTHTHTHTLFREGERENRSKLSPLSHPTADYTESEAMVDPVALWASQTHLLSSGAHASAVVM